MYKYLILLLSLSSLNLFAQIVSGGAHEIPKDEEVKRPQHVVLTEEIIRKEFKDELGEVGLKGSPSNLKVSFNDVVKVHYLYKSINQLKAVDIACSKKLKSKAVLKGTKTLEDVIDTLSVAFYTDKVTTGVKTFDSKKCNCDETTSKQLKCIKSDETLKKKLNTSITSEEDLKHLLDIIYLEDNKVNDKVLKKLIEDFYGDSK